MNIEIKKSKNPVNYIDAIKDLEERLRLLNENKSRELIWILEHESIYTAGTSYSKNEILDKKIKIYETNRGGKITYHGPGQLVFYFVIDLKNKKKDIRKFISVIENSVIDFLKNYNIEARAFKNRVGIWVIKNNKITFDKEKKISAIGLRVKKWIS